MGSLVDFAIGSLCSLVAVISLLFGVVAFMGLAVESTFRRSIRFFFVEGGGVERFSQVLKQGCQKCSQLPVVENITIVIIVSYQGKRKKEMEREMENLIFETPSKQLGRLGENNDCMYGRQRRATNDVGTD